MPQPARLLVSEIFITCMMADGSTGSPRRNRRPTKQEQKQREQHALAIYNRTTGTRDDRWRQTQRQLEREFAASGGNPRSKAFTLMKKVLRRSTLARAPTQPFSLRAFMRRRTKPAIVRLISEFGGFAENDVSLRSILRSMARPSTPGIGRVKVMSGFSGMRSPATALALAALLADERTNIVAVNLGELFGNCCELFDALLEALERGKVAYVFVDTKDMGVEYVRAFQAVTKATRHASLRAWAEAGGAAEDEPLWHREDEIELLCRAAGGGEDAAFAKPLFHLDPVQRKKQRRRASFGVTPWKTSKYDLEEESEE